MGEEIDDLPVLKKTSNGYEKIYSQGDDLPVIKKKLTESNETQSAPTNGVQEVSTSDSQTVVEPSLESGGKDSFLAEANKNFGKPTEQGIQESNFQQGIIPKVDLKAKQVKLATKQLEKNNIQSEAAKHYNAIEDNSQYPVMQEIGKLLEQRRGSTDLAEIDALEKNIAELRAQPVDDSWRKSGKVQIGENDFYEIPNLKKSAYKTYGEMEDATNKASEKFTELKGKADLLDAELTPAIQQSRNDAAYVPDGKDEQGNEYVKLNPMQSFVEGFGGSVDAIGLGLKKLNPLYSREELKNDLKIKYLRDNVLFPKQADGVIAQGTEMLGGVAPLMATGAVGATGIGAMAVNALTFGTMDLGGGMFEGFAEGKAKGMDDDDAMAFADKIGIEKGITGTVLGATMPMQSALGRKIFINKAEAGALKTFLAEQGVMVPAFMSKTLIDNLGAKAVGSDRDVTEGVAEAGASAFMIGAMTHAIATIPKLPKATKNIFEKAIGKNYKALGTVINKAVQEGAIDAETGERIAENAKAYETIGKDLEPKLEEKILPKQIEIDNLQKKNEGKSGAFVEANEGRIEELNKEIREELGTPLNEKEQKEYDKLIEKRDATDAEGKKEKLLQSEKNTLDHYKARIKNNSSANNVSETPQRVTYKDGRSGLLVKDAEGNIEFIPDGNSKSVTFEKGETTENKSVKQLGFTVHPKEIVAQPNSQIVSGELKVGGEVLYKGKRYEIAENKNAPEGFKKDADGKVKVIYLKDADGNRIVVGADNADGVSLIADANKLAGNKVETVEQNPFTREKQQGEVGETETFNKDGKKITPKEEPTPEKVEVKEEPVVEPPKSEVVETPAEETPAPKKKTQKEIKEENKFFKQEILVAEPMTPRQMIMQWFAGGGKLNTDDFKNETGFKNGEEFRKRIWAHTRNKYFMRDRKGMRVGKEVSPYSMDDLVMAIKNEWADGYGKELDEQDIRNEIIDVLQSHNTPSEIIENLRQDFSDKDGNIIGNRYDRADIRNQEAQEAMGVFEKADEHAENENVVEAIEKVDEVELSEKDISSIKEFLSKFTDENGEVDWAKAEESSQDVFNPEFGLLTDKASKQIEKIIADGKAKNDGRKQSENLSENTGDKGNNGGQDKAEGEGEKIIKQEYSQKLAEADAKIEAAKQAKETEVNAINKRANLFGGDTGAEKNKGLFGAQKDDYAQIEKIVAEHDRKIAESEGAKQKLLEQQDRDIANAVDVEKRQQKMELKEDVVGKEISFAHAGSDKTGTVNAVDKDGNYKVKIGGINYTVKPENVIKDAIKAEERIAIEKENDNLKNEIEGLIKKSSKKGDAKADAKKIVKLGVPGTQQLADLPNKIFQNLVADKVRKFEDKVARTLQRGAISQTNSLRHIADFISSFSRGIMDTREYSESHRKILKGGINRAKQDAEDLHGQLWNLIGGDINSADRIHQVLDPDLRGTGLTFADLTAQEQQLHDLLRGINNYTHNQNYLLGKISKETYDKYKDKYVGREYDYEKDYDQTVGGKSIREILGIYKKRGDVDADKLLHSIKDPIYLTLRRYMQTGQNKAVSEYADWIFRNNNEFVSNTERDGFQFLGNGFGRLSNKYVARHVAEDFKGFVFNNTFMQLAYDVNKVYDGLAPRQFMKELLTVFNPQVQLGNYTSNMVFSWMGGVDLPTYLSKQPEAYRQIRDRGDVFRKLQSEGLLGTDFVSSDLVPMQDVLGAPATRNAFRKAESKARNLYSGVDDSAKIQMYLSLKDMGYSDAQAYQTIFESLQNYQNTGRIWDFASKTPVIGNSFVKFTPEMLRLLKNGMTRRPLHTMAFVGLMSAMPKLVGKYFGDDDEEIKAAGNQKGIPKIMIPYTDMSIPLSWRLGDKRVNVARFLMPIYMYDIGGENKVATDFANKFIPYQFKTTEEGGITPFNIQDPLVAPILSTIMNKDFRDKPIVEETDDNEGLFNEANFKRLRYIARGYGGFYANTIDDIFSANITGEDFYGRRKTATDIALNTLIKIETFDDARLKEGIVREFDGYERVTNKLYQEYTKKRKALQGDIDQIEADKLMGAERKKELIAKKEIRLTDVSENVLTDISDIQKQQLDATEFYKNLSRKQPYTDLTKEFQDSKKKIDQIEKRIDGKFKDSNTGGFNFGIKKPKFGG